MSTFERGEEHQVHSIREMPRLSPERLHDGHAVLEAVADHAWECRVVLNPAAVLIEDGPELEALLGAWGLADEHKDRLRTAGGACVMPYRAQGEEEPRKSHAPSYVGLAVFTPGLELIWRRPEPVIRPEEPFHNLGVEDPRCTKVDDTYYLYYTGYATEREGDEEADTRVRICLATTQDFLTWDLHGPVEGDVNDVDNKNAALLPEPVAGRWRLLHRPMQGSGAMAIHLAEADDPAGPWLSTGVLMRSRRYAEFDRSWIGGGGPPLSIGGERFVMIYHLGHYTPQGDREYDLGAALLDFSIEPIVTERIEPFMRPDGPRERLGDAELGVDNVLFTCANYRWRDRLVIPYAGADSRVFGAEVAFEQLVEVLGGS